MFAYVRARLNLLLSRPICSQYSGLIVPKAYKVEEQYGKKVPPILQFYILFL